MKKLDLAKIVIEHNSKIVNKKDIQKITLNENDMVEIISFVGGG